jgi:hypothetical protein
MDRYAENLKVANELKTKIVRDILDTLDEKGYKVGDTVKTIQCFFKIEYDRLLIKKSGDDCYWHTDHLNIDELLYCLRAAMHAMPKLE